MEKRTLLAVVLSVIVISGGYLVQNWLYPPTPTINESTSSNPTAENPVAAPTLPASQEVPSADKQPTLVAVSEPSAEQVIEIRTDLIRARISNRGGDIVSYKLLNHKDGSDYVEMVLPGDSEPHAFSMALGGPGSERVDALFHVKRISDTSVEFYRDFVLSTAQSEEPGIYRITKRYTFIPGEYLFELGITVDGGFSKVPFSNEGVAYTLEFGPQIGPKFAKLTQNYEYRRYYSYANGKRKTEKVNAKGFSEIQDKASWAAIAGKYFTFIAIPDATAYKMAFSSEPLPGISETSRFFMTRPSQTGSKFSNTFRFYLGPKTQKALSVYDNADRNPYKLSNMNMASVVDSSGILGPLEVAMKWFMLIFYKLIPNYGVSIILLTILVKILMFPLTKKSSESTIRMQALSPKIKEIQEKYKDNPNKMNAEMAEFYKREGYNPLSGCLPMIIQIPIFFAMYNLFNNHFDLRGAMFIPGWIPDLSLPEYVWDFSPFKIPFLNWSHLRILPFIYLGSQLLYGKVTQTPDQQGNSQMKMMLYMMPIVFFFMLYDVPAGLLLYWIMSNLLTMVQQVAINKYLAQRKAHILKEQTTPVIVPKRKKN